jgi:DNA primase
VAGRILKEDIESLRAQADIVTVVADYTQVRRAGRSFKGLCPFHTERTPSFTVTPEGNFFHCFGCGASGDIYDFLMRIEGLEFPEAVESLARRTGFQLRYEELSSRERRAIGERSRLVSTTAAAAAFFQEQLYAPAGEIAREYLKSRGFGRADAQRFDLGYAPNEWEALARALTGQGVAESELIEVGVCVRTERGGLRDRFRGRLIFPVHDAGGDVIGFGGRVLPGEDYGDFDPPKYLNSPETPLYKKTRVLYGVPQARADIVRAGEVVVCEGYTDVMALHQAGFGNAVATCGTAVGIEHLKLISRYAQRAVLAFDADEAGVKAAERAWEAARELGAQGTGTALELRVLVLPEGRDPADLVRDAGVEGMQDAVAAAVPVVPFLLRHQLGAADLTSESGRTAALRDALTVLAREPDADLRREWARSEVAARIGLSYDFVAATARRMDVELDRHEGVAVAAPRRAEASTRAGADPDRARARREREVLRVALQHPELLPEEWHDVRVEDLTHPTARAVLHALQQAGGAGVDTRAVLEAAGDDELRATIRALTLEEEPAPLDAGTAARRVRSLLSDRLAWERDELRERLQRLNHQRDLEELLDVQRRLAEVERRRRELAEPGD